MTYDDTTRDAALTAYALGELPPDEAAEVEARLEHDAAARQHVEQIRATAGLLERALATEAIQPPVGEDSSVVAGRIGNASTGDASSAPQTEPLKWLRRSGPRHWALAAAAAVVVGGITAGVLLVENEPPRQVAIESSPAEEADPSDSSGGGSGNRDGSDVVAVPLAEPEGLSAFQAERQNERQLLVHRYNEALSNARDAVSRGEFDDAGIALYQARTVRNTSPLLFTEEELSRFDEGISRVRQAAESRQDQALRSQDSRVRLEEDREARSRELSKPQPPAATVVEGLQQEQRPAEQDGQSEADAALEAQIELLEGLADVAPAERPLAAKDSHLLPTDDKAPAASPADTALRMLPQEDFNGDRVRAGGLSDLYRFAPPIDREAYDRLVDNPFFRPGESPMSTFSIDVDTASYANVRRFLSNGQMPPPDAVRIEELINYFQYDYPRPESPEVPFAADIAVASAPWNPEHRLVRIGLQAVDVDAESRPGANLVFLVDVSGSMNSPDKLPLVQQGLRTMTARLDERDRVAMVVYAGSSGVVLGATSGSDYEAILRAIDQLQAGGSTNGAAGIKEAYDLARKSFREGGVNRVILATDGDFNVGITDRGQLTRLIEEQAKSGIYLTVLGFGTGNLQDATMEELSNKGNGFYAYVDSEREAERVLGERMLSTVQAVAKDVKLQVEFNPAKVGAYRLIGYANRLLEDRDFNDDTKDAGDTGAGHQVTAFYEIIPPAVLAKQSEAQVKRLRETLEHLKAAQAAAGVTADGSAPFADEIAEVEAQLERLAATQLPPPTDSLKYQQPATMPAEASDELVTVKLRWKTPDEAKVQGTSEKVEWPVVDEGQSFEEADGEFQFAATVAGFGMLLRESPYVGEWTWTDLDAQVEPLRERAERARLTPEGVRRYVEFPELVRTAASLAK